MSDQQTFAFFSDPGHAWLEVPRSLLRELGIESKISNFSYQKGQMVYLEEDCDYAVFVRAMRQAGREPNITNKAGDAGYIRNYAHFQPQGV